MLETNTWRSGNVNGAEAACMIALALLRSEKSVTIVTFKNLGIHVMNIDKTASFGQAMKRLQQMPGGNINLAKPISWAAHQNYKYDVFINIVDQIFEKFDTSEKALEAYKTKLKLTNTKYVFLNYFFAKIIIRTYCTLFNSFQINKLCCVLFVDLS